LCLSDRAESINSRTPEAIVDLTLYRTEEGGRKGPIRPGYMCGCSADPPQTMQTQWSGAPQLGDAWMQPGETRRVGYVFLGGAPAAAAVCRGERFYLYEGRKAVGEAVIVRP